ncbi:MAG: 30S ribosomal protein S20 [Candidatus Omnitrophica bacterium]|nr:30S ribosomal protein S20 [Candidatus Omnitrophota bacterium]
MPIKKAALKRVRADKKRHERNSRIINDLRTRVKALRRLISEKKTDEARRVLAIVIPKIDKAVRKKVLHKNKASRTVSRLMKAVNKSAAA